MDLGLRDKVFVVTGGSRGLGRATAETLVAEGAKVVIAARSPESLDETIRALGAAAVGVVADTADPGAAERLLAAAHERFGRIDGALVSTGGPPAGRAVDVTDEQWRESFESIFLGALRVAKVLAPAMAPGGAFAFVLSSSVRVPIAGLALSNGLRAGLAMMVKTLADELGPKGLRAVGLMPGRIQTERLRGWDVKRDQDELRKAIARIPLRRDGMPEEFGRVAAFVLSPAASYLSGIMIPVDGGDLRAL